MINHLNHYWNQLFRLGKQRIKKGASKQKEAWFRTIVEIILVINIISLFIGALYTIGILSKL